MLYIVLEYCDGGDFAAYIRARRRLGEGQAQFFMRQLALGLAYLHRRGVAHRDLKPHNLLLSDKSATPVMKIADFGFARMMSEAQLATTVCGSPLYMAPEVLSGKQYTDKADLWSVGAIFYEMLVGSPPFRARSPVELNELIHRVAAVKLPADIAVSAECGKLVTALLTVSTGRRISWDAFLQDSWIGITPTELATPAPTPKAATPQQQRAAQHQELPRDIVSPVLTTEVPPQEAGAPAATPNELSGSADSEFELLSAGAVSSGSAPVVIPPPRQHHSTAQPASTSGSSGASRQPAAVAAALVPEAPTTPDLHQQRQQLLSSDPFQSPPGFASPPPVQPPAERLAEELAEWGKMATAIAALGDLKVEAEYRAEGFALYVHALSVLRNALLTAQRRVALRGIVVTPPTAADPRLRDALDALRARLAECLEKAERLRVQLAPHEKSVLPEKLVYDHAMLLSREGTLAEKTGMHAKAHGYYEDALALFNSLVPTVPSEHDKDVLFRYTSLLRKRLEATASQS